MTSTWSIASENSILSIASSKSALSFGAAASTISGLWAGPLGGAMAAGSGPDSDRKPWRLLIWTALVAGIVAIVLRPKAAK